jgi:ubiquinone/menaquinone biosynthesis C-methylase UbiE
MNERKTHWEQVYATKAMDSVSWFQPDASPSISLLEEMQLAEDAAIIDVGGGTSPFTRQLCERGYNNLSVLDISRNALTLARDAVGEFADRVHWIEADVTEFSSQQRYMLWHDRAVFHFLVDVEDRRRYVSNLRACLESGGWVVIAAFATDGPNRCSGLDTMRYDATSIAEVFGGDFILRQNFNEVHRTPSEAEQRFAWFLFQYIPYR